MVKRAENAAEKGQDEGKADKVHAPKPALIALRALAAEYTPKVANDTKAGADPLAVAS